MVRSEVLLSPSYLRKHFARDWDLGIPASAAAPRVAKQIARSLINSHSFHTVTGFKSIVRGI